MNEQTNMAAAFLQAARDNISRPEDMSDEEFEALVERTMAIQIRDEEVRMAGEDYVYDGDLVSITFHDPSMAHNGQWICMMAQAIGRKIQDQRIWAEDTIADIQSKAKDNMDESITTGDQVDINTGTLPGLTLNQEIFMDSLEDQLDVLRWLDEDMRRFFNENNDNEKSNFKYIYNTDAEARAYKAQRDAKKAEAKRAELMQVREYRAKARAAAIEARARRRLHD